MNLRKAEKLYSIRCPHCGEPLSSGARRCGNCGWQFPRWYSYTPFLKEIITGRFSFLNGITIACSIVYLLSLVIDFTHVSYSRNILTFLSPGPAALYRLGMGGAVAIQNRRWWTLLSANYLHGSLLHLIFNLYWLRKIGAMVEEFFGKSRFWVIYTVGGAAGSLISALAGTQFFVGASGAIFGLFGALIYYGRYRGGTYGTGIFRQVLLLAGVSLLFGLIMPGVDNWGHLGGFSSGLITAFLVGYEERIPQSLWMHVLAWLLLLIVLVCFAIILAVFL